MQNFHLTRQQIGKIHNIIVSRRLILFWRRVYLADNWKLLVAVT
ncbi:hypothetical protein CDL12_17380 [Handroanthus impetiginosus]|uniref:Uncharacterized protein n=1 Tax=Handroanthus impetiginosus TaxID=429701 RepID=A0A2G9GXM9_9LAMI|nr:hypothetical protein CDL12_17380 [Handroanthus impetiginosus]